MDKFVVRYATSDEAIPAVWKTSPLPKSTPKRPVGRPRKRKVTEEDSPSVQVIADDTVQKVLNHVVDKVCASVDKQSGDCSRPEAKKQPEMIVAAAVSRGQYKSFTAAQKIQVVDYARMHGVRVASRQFKVPKSTISNWNKIDFNEQRNKSGHLAKSGRPITYSEEVEEKIVEFVLEQRDLQNAVSIDELCSFAKATVEPQHPDFKASRTWAAKFMRRHDMVLRAKTSVAQRLPADLEEKIGSFHSFVKEQRLRDEFEDRFIINMDETPVYFDLVPGKTIDFRGNKSVRIRTSGSEKRHLTVLLAVSADGNMLPPMVVFKGKRELKFPVPSNWIVTVQEKGWMDEALMLRWIQDIYLKYTGKERSLLVLDSFRAHKTEKVLKALRKGNTVPAIIPGGCTSKIQPLDVSINKPFKAELRKEWTAYMRTASQKLSVGEKVKAATKELVIKWLENACDYISSNRTLIMKSFLVCGISNSLNGSEDSLVREDVVATGNFIESDEDEEEFEGFSPEDLPDFD